MVAESYKIEIYDQLTDTKIWEYTGVEGDWQTVWDLAESVWYEICQTKWWSILSHSLSLFDDIDSPVYKYIEPQAETITGFYLDWTEYKFGWWWASYTAGNWIDITNNEIWLDGTYEWDGGKDYSAMRWPAPDGFHVPLTEEWQWVKTIMDWLGLTTWNNWRINLHMPFSGSRKYSTADLINQGSTGYYWSSSPSSAGSDYARYLYLDSSNVRANGSNRRAYGFSVRCFKDSFELPTSSWTIITWTLWSAGIFWNQTAWLISITDWTTGYTIMDKNLWATSVYNDWNTLTQANMWNMYHWWNNYWFPSTWSVSTSSTQVDASNYWPWNYYSSSTFIKWSNDWSIVHNDNLWWGETWVQPIMISRNLVLWDKLYKIVTSTSAPASWTASNVITIVTD